MKHTRHMHPTIEICKKCGGDGLQYVYHDFDLLKQEPVSVTDCKICEGSGRVIVSKITQITVEPFKN